MIQISVIKSSVFSRLLYFFPHDSFNLLLVLSLTFRDLLHLSIERYRLLKLRQEEIHHTYNLLHQKSNEELQVNDKHLRLCFYRSNTGDSEILLTR